MPAKITTLIYTGRRGRSPLDPTLWSSISSRLHKELDQRGKLKRAIGIEVPGYRKLALLARNLHWSRSAWRGRLLTCVEYREALTSEVRAQLRETNIDGAYLQIGATFDTPRVLDGRAACYSYHDGCLAESLKSPLPRVKLSTRAIDRALDFERRIYQEVDRVFTFSRYLRDSIIANYGVSPDRVTAIGSGINLEPIPDAPRDKRYDSQELLFIGVDFDRKGGQQLLQAFRSLNEKYPKAVLHIVGPKTLAISGALSKNVVCHGFLSKQDSQQRAALEKLFQRACLFVMPSLYEPFGIAPLEAMVQEIPAVVTNGWALKEIVQPGVTGELVEVGEVDDLRDKLDALLGSPDRLRELGQRARQSVVGEFRWDLVVQRMLNAIEAKPMETVRC